MSVRFSVNLNAIALLRNRRNLPWPDMIALGRMALRAGASGITVHPRPDERHIRFSDLAQIRHLLDEEFPSCQLNIEGYPTQNFLDLVVENRADQVTLVPDHPEQMTSDHGWDFAANAILLSSVIAFLKKHCITVSLFADPESKGLDIAQQIGATHIELFTGPYGASWNDPCKRVQELEKITTTARYAQHLGFSIHAGHDLTIDNLPPLIQQVPFLSEVSIGHGFIADALEYGMTMSVKRFLAALNEEDERVSDNKI